LRWLLAYFEGNITLAAAYNAGEGVNRYAGVPPYAETQGYVKRIRNFREMSTRLTLSTTPSQLASEKADAARAHASTLHF
jgi:soluble lytic murein transglycosylase-like protein